MRLPKYGPPVDFVRWDQLSDFAKNRLLTSGHPSNRPTKRDIRSGRRIFRCDGSGWLIGCVDLSAPGLPFHPSVPGGDE